MNIQRAKEISALPEMVHVTHNGVPVYIQRVDEDTKTARVYPLYQPDREQTVPLNSLTEH
ncbi:H-type small acid-soluble spore protein [Bacillus xiapuensis]|uniref:H-type small acid-soluble spore protein n=1 Tax=Bacillus xiapuensis TaxID=2014075 RepID=UPI000C2509A9|nr:H-type small acid-soluble spore protein [Bacillus xiapuensis]